MSQKSYKPADIAKELDVSTNTIRMWCNTFGDHLTDRATPAIGRERIISPVDRTVLHYIAGLRADGFNYDEIASRLAETSFSDGEVLEADQVPTSKAEQVPAIAPQAAPAADQVTAIAAMLADAHVKQLEDIRGRLSQVEATQAQQAEQNDTSRLLVAFALGIAVTVAAVLIAAWLM